MPGQLKNEERETQGERDKLQDKLNKLGVELRNWDQETSDLVKQRRQERADLLTKKALIQKQIGAIDGELVANAAKQRRLKEAAEAERQVNVDKAKKERAAKQAEDKKRIASEGNV